MQLTFIVIMRGETAMTSTSLLLRPANSDLYLFLLLQMMMVNDDVDAFLQIFLSIQFFFCFAVPFVFVLFCFILFLFSLNLLICKIVFVCNFCLLLEEFHKCFCCFCTVNKFAFGSLSKIIYKLQICMQINLDYDDKNEKRNNI